MTKPLIHSYTSLAEWRLCPRLHKARFIDKIIKFVESPALIRGKEDHAILERAIKQREPIPEPYKVKQGLVPVLHKLDAKAEVPRAIDREGNFCNFFDNSKAWLRGKIDVRAPILAPDPSEYRPKGVIMVDWKGGKPGYTDELQAKVYGAMEWAICGAPKSLFFWAYVRYPVDESPPPQTIDNAEAYKEVTDLIARVEADTEHAPRPSWKCRFCDLVSCEYNERGK